MNRKTYTRIAGLIPAAMITATVAFSAITANAYADLPQAPKPAEVKPTWATSHDAHLPGCINVDAKRDWIPRQIVTVDRKGVARLWPYTDETIATIDAGWDNETPADDEYTVGKCR